SWHGPAPEARLPHAGGDRPERPGVVPAADPEALLRRPDPRRVDRLRRAAGTLADDARVRGRPGDVGSSADGDRALRQLERREAEGRARPAAVRDARGAPHAPAGARRAARPRADGEGHRREPEPLALEVALLAYLRIAHERAPRGRLRRPGGGGASREGARARRR